MYYTLRKLDPFDGSGHNIGASYRPTIFYQCEEKKEREDELKEYFKIILENSSCNCHAVPWQANILDVKRLSPGLFHKKSKELW